MDYLQYLKQKKQLLSKEMGFKPYYKWITFNTCKWDSFTFFFFVLNLIINGLPSILHKNHEICRILSLLSFKPYYKWITFNTYEVEDMSVYANDL